jgi:hypothetical protein
MFSPRAPYDALKYRALWLLLGYSGAALVVYLSLTPSPHHVVALTLGDKVEHILAFAAPVFWFGQIYSSARGQRGVAIVAAITAVALEIGQKYIGGYDGIEYGDILASGVGIAFGGALLLKTPLGNMLARFDKWSAERWG